MEEGHVNTAIKPFAEFLVPADLQSLSKPHLQALQKIDKLWKMSNKKVQNHIDN